MILLDGIGYIHPTKWQVSLGEHNDVLDNVLFLANPGIVVGLVEQFSIKGHLEALSSGDLGAMTLNHFDQTNGSILMGEAINWSVGGHQVSLFWRHTITPLAIRSAYGSVKNRVYSIYL